jgi:hypothetical protein|tara:strand:+ start:127 stop:339 length:213 start_codon:yes stop_codon:yes gene_type:complete
MSDKEYDPEEYKVRTIFEKEEIDRRIVDLDIFIASPGWHHISDMEQIRLERQRNAMEEYTTVMEDRIRQF